jgi:hypothetical protein
MNSYTTIGYWNDTMQRFADIVEAANPDEAERICLDQHHGLSICGVIEGQHHCVDFYEFARTLEP